MTAGFAALIIGGLSAASAAADDQEPGQDFEQRCSDLAELDLADVTQFSSELVAEGQEQANLPEYCRVALTVDPQVNIEVWLPTSTYNGRFQAVGGGGYAGTISYGAMRSAVSDGYATASTDTGHVGAHGGFALTEDGELDWGLIEDFASRSLIQLTEKAQILIEEFYGAAEDYSYFNGCSTGGRQGLVLAQQLPDAYDGIMAGAPAINWDRFIPAELWPQILMEEELGGPIEPCKLDVATQAAVAACDTLDGVEDGVIENPRDCDFDPSTLIGQETACGVFTEADARVIAGIWQGPQTSDGESLWYGLAPGAPLDGLAGPQPFAIALQHVTYWLAQDPDFDFRTIDSDEFERLFRQSQELFNEVIGTDDPDLSAFRDAGGKTLLWHGWNDQLIFPEGTIDYYERVQGTLGEEETLDFARLFMAPGVGHCSGGPGPQPVDPFGALVDWVENGNAPEQLDAALTADGEVVRTRPLCLYPEVAVWSGSGSTDVAENFDCRLVDEGPGEPGDGEGIPLRARVPELGGPGQEPGSLTLSVADFGEVVDLGTALNAGDRLRFSGDLPTVTVTDTRNTEQAGTAGGWTASGQAGDFTSQADSFSASYLGWVPGLLQAPPDITPGATVRGELSGGPGLAQPATLASAAGEGRLGSTDMGADLVLEIPVDTDDGEYRSTMTVSVFPVD